MVNKYFIPRKCCERKHKRKDWHQKDWCCTLYIYDKFVLFLGQIAAQEDSWKTEVKYILPWN